MDMADGMDVISVYTPADPEGYEQYMVDMMGALGRSPMIKQARVEPLEPHQGFSANKATIAFDVDKMVEQAGAAPGAAAMVRTMLGDGTMTNYFGTDGKQLVSLTADDDTEAQARFDALRSGKGTVGASKGLQDLLSRLPSEVNLLMAIEAQGFVRTMGKFLGTVAGGGAVLPPGDLPREPAFAGMALTTYPEGYGLEFVVPSANGPVLEKGMTPIIQALMGRVNQ
jgi:hypothetical protein